MKFWVPIYALVLVHLGSDTGCWANTLTSVVPIPIQSISSGYQALLAGNVTARQRACVVKHSTLNCDSINLRESLPDAIQFPEIVEFADFRNNKIDSLTTGIFISGRKLKYLYLANNMVVQLEKNVFENLTSLRNLDLSHNFLVTLPGGCFSGLIHLNMLDLGYNKLITIDRDIFAGAFSLRELRLNHNELSEVGETTLDDLTNMDALDLEDNMIKTLPDNVFDQNSRLRDLKLGMNPFIKIPNASIRSAKVLEILDLSSTRVREITSEDFENMSTVTKLRISRVGTLERIGDHAFKDLVNLRSLNIEYNRKLKYISPLAFVNNDTDEHIVELIEVSLKGNSLTTLDSNTLLWSMIPEVDLSDNPWKCDCHLSWIVNVTVIDRTEENYICKQPYKHFNQRIKDMNEDDFSCSVFENDVFVVGGILIILLTATFITSIGFLVAKLKIIPKIMSFFYHPKDHATGSHYVRVIPAGERVDILWSAHPAGSTDPVAAPATEVTPV